MGKMNLINITDNEWNEAENILKEKLHKLYKLRESRKNNSVNNINFKISRKSYPILEHSFVYIENILICLERSKYIGLGSYGKVKLCQTRGDSINPPEKFALKIESHYHKEQFPNYEKEIMMLLGTWKGLTAAYKKPTYK